MIAFWLAWHTFAVFRGQPGWLPLLACLAVLIAKRLYWTPGLIMLVVVMGVVAFFQVARSRREWPSATVARLSTLAVWLAWSLFLVDWRAAASCSRQVALVPDRPVVCIGDSVTSGLLPEKGYPDVMANLLALRVVNMGQSGINTDAALGMLPRVKEAHPQVVVIELGGHDFLQGKSRAATQRNLERLITSCKEIGAEVVLVEVPRGFMTDPFAGLERELARKYDLQLVADSVMRQFVLWSPISPPGMWLRGSHLSDDGIHPNKRGTQYLAEAVAKALVQMYGDRIRTGSHSESRNTRSSRHWPLARVSLREGTSYVEEPTPDGQARLWQDDRGPSRC
jgi:lysophospholipase L1-like esterase